MSDPSTIASAALPASGDRAGNPSPSLAPGVASALGRGARRAAYGVAGVLLVGSIWFLVSLTLPDVRLPSPLTVVTTLRDDFTEIPALLFVSFQAGGIRDAALHTGASVLIGVGIGTVIGFPLGAILGRVRVLRDLFAPAMLALTTIPILIVLPFLLIWFGTARITQSGLVILFSIATVATVTQNATLDVAGRFTDYAASVGASRGLVLREVILPAIVPPAIGAVRVAAGAGWSFAALAELLGGNAGTGKLIQTMQGMSATPDIMAALLALGVLAVFLDAVIAASGRWIVRWQD